MLNVLKALLGEKMTHILNVWIHTQCLTFDTEVVIVTNLYLNRVIMYKQYVMCLNFTT